VKVRREGGQLLLFPRAADAAPSQWSVQRVRQWLGVKGFGRLAVPFERAFVSGDVLLSMNAARVRIFHPAFQLTHSASFASALAELQRMESLQQPPSLSRDICAGLDPLLIFLLFHVSLCSPLVDVFYHSCDLCFWLSLLIRSLRNNCSRVLAIFEQLFISSTIMECCFISNDCVAFFSVVN
jgi:hypothetical protein